MPFLPILTPFASVLRLFWEVITSIGYSRSENWLPYKKEVPYYLKTEVKRLQFYGATIIVVIWVPLMHQFAIDSTQKYFQMISMNSSHQKKPIDMQKSVTVCMIWDISKFGYF